MTSFEQDPSHNGFTEPISPTALLINRQQQLFDTQYLAETMSKLIGIDDMLEAQGPSAQDETVARGLVQDIFTATHSYIDSYLAPPEVDQYFRLGLVLNFDTLIRMGINPIFDSNVANKDIINPNELFSVGVLKHANPTQEEIDEFYSARELDLAAYALSSAKGAEGLSTPVKHVYDFELDDSFYKEFGKSDKARSVINPLGWADRIRQWRKNSR